MILFRLFEGFEIDVIVIDFVCIFDFLLIKLCEYELLVLIFYL